jgi:hypothetical protein
MFMWMLHEVWLRLSKVNVYVNVTRRSLVDKYYWRKCLCECYMKFDCVWVKQMFMWMLHEVWLINTIEGNVYVNVNMKFDCVLVK